MLTTALVMLYLGKHESGQNGGEECVLSRASTRGETIRCLYKVEGLLQINYYYTLLAQW